MEVNDSVPDVLSLRPITLDLGGVTYQLFPRRFSTGSIGWYCSTKGAVQDHRCQFSLTITIIGSKGLKLPEQNCTMAQTQPKTPLFDREAPIEAKPVKRGRKQS